MGGQTIPNSVQVENLARVGLTWEYRLARALVCFLISFRVCLPGRVSSVHTVHVDLRGKRRRPLARHCGRRSVYEQCLPDLHCARGVLHRCDRWGRCWITPWSICEFSRRRLKDTFFRPRYKRDDRERRFGRTDLTTYCGAGKARKNLSNVKWHRLSGSGWARASFQLHNFPWQV